MLKLRLAFQGFGAFFASSAFAGSLELQLQGQDGKGVGAAVVVLRSTDPARPVARPVQEAMNQREQQFEPHVLIVPTGSAVTFPNKDSVQHQVYSFSPATAKENQFELPLYRGTPRPINFSVAGVVTVKCNIHDNMRGYIFVVDGQYFGHTDASGSWRVPDVLPGVYNVQIWHPRARNMKPVFDQKITVTTAEPRVILRLATPLKLRPATEVPGNWDAY